LWNVALINLGATMIAVVYNEYASIMIVPTALRKK